MFFFPLKTHFFQKMQLSPHLYSHQVAFPPPKEHFFFEAFPSINDIFSLSSNFFNSSLLKFGVVIPETRLELNHESSYKITHIRSEIPSGFGCDTF